MFRLDDPGGQAYVSVSTLNARTSPLASMILGRLAAPINLFVTQESARTLVLPISVRGRVTQVSLRVLRNSFLVGGLPNKVLDGLSVFNDPLTGGMAQ